MRKEESPIVVKESFNQSAEIVWNSITTAEQMCQWFFENITAFKPEIGFETQFNVESGGRNFLHQWKVTEVEPLKKITYNWKYEGYPGNSFVTFELSKEQNSKIGLQVSHRVEESFPENIPEFSRENCFGGWEFFINKNLKAFLEKI